MSAPEEDELDEDLRPFAELLAPFRDTNSGGPGGAARPPWPGDSIGILPTCLIASACNLVEVTHRQPPLAERELSSQAPRAPGGNPGAHVVLQVAQHSCLKI
jgi:hypothetical protein